MKKYLNRIIVLAFLFMLGALIEVQANSEKEYNNIVYVIDNGSAVIKGFSKPEEVIDVPEEIEGYTVKALELYGGVSDKTKVLKIPKTVERIDYCTMIRQAKSLESIEVDQNNNWFKTIDGVLYNKDITKMLLYPRNNKMKKYREPDTIVGQLNGVMSIRDYSCSNNLEEIVFSHNAKNETVGYMVSCPNLKKVRIPSNVISVFGGDVDKDGVFRDCKKLQTVVFEKKSKTKYIASNAFSSCEKLKSIKLPSSLVSINAEAFYKCSSLKKVSFPKKLKTIGYKAFYNCKRLKNIKLRKGIRTIKAYAFRKTKIKKVVIYKSTKKVSKKAFDKKCKIKRKKK